MATAAKTGPQDMPPPGGYDPIQWQRIKLRTIFDVKLTVAFWAITTAVGFTGYVINKRRLKRNEIEMRSARNAMLPLLVAERDRAFLKQLRINRDEERELMKNDPEWEVGTYYREPIYITTPEKFYEPNFFEFMGHADNYDINKRVLRRHYH